jgi:hypothetical protein
MYDNIGQTSVISNHTWERTPYAGGFFTVLDKGDERLTALSEELARTGIANDISEETAQDGSLRTIVSISEFAIPAHLKDLFKGEQKAQRC